MKPLFLIYSLLLCFASKAQTREGLIKLYNKVVRIDRLYNENTRKLLMQTGDNWKERTPKEDSIQDAKNILLEDERTKAHDEYNAYWFKYHEKKGDLKQKLSPNYYGTGN